MATNTTSHNLAIGGISQAVAQVNLLNTQLHQLQQQLTNVQSGTTAFNSLTQQVQQTTGQINRLNQQINATNGNRINALRNAAAGMTQSFSTAASTATNLAGQIGQVTGANDILMQNTQLLTDVMGLFGNVSMRGFFQFTQGSSMASKAVQLFSRIAKAALASTGIGLLVIALGSVVAYFTRTQRGADRLAVGMAYLSGIFTGIVNILTRLGEKMVDAFLKPQKTIDEITEKIKGVWEVTKNLFSGEYSVSDVWNATKEAVTDLTNEIGKLKDEVAATADASVAVEKLKVAYERADLALVRQTGRLQQIIEANRAIAENTTATSAEREKAHKRAFAAEQELLNFQMKAAQANYDYIKANNALSDSSREDLKLEAEAQNKINELVGQRQKLNTESSRFNAELAKETAEKIIAAEQSKLEQTLATNEAIRDDDTKTLGEREKAAQAIYDATVKYIEVSREALKLAGDSAEAATKRAELNKLEIQNTAQLTLSLKELSKAYRERDLAAGERVQKASLDLRKLDAEEIASAEAKKIALQQIADDEIFYLDKKYAIEIQKEGLTNKELEALEAEHALNVANIRKGLADKIRSIDEKEAEEKRSRLEKELELQKKLVDTLKGAYGTLSESFLSMTDTMVQANVAAFEAQMTEIDALISSIDERVDEINSRIEDAQATIDDLESQLLTAKGKERERIIKLLEAERLKQSQLNAERKKEDERIKQAEKEKLKIEKEKEKALARQVKIQQAMVMVQSLMVGVESTLAGIEAAKAGIAGMRAAAEASTKGKFGWDNIAILIAATAAVLGSIVSIRNAAKSMSSPAAGYAEGGYTGDGSKYEEAGVVHKGEYVIPKWMVQRNKSLISMLEQQRTRGYADGGMVTARCVYR